MSSLSIGIDLGSHWTRVGIIEESGQFRMIYKMRSLFAFDQSQSEVPTFGEDVLKADSYKIIADANRDQNFASEHDQVTSSPPSSSSAAIQVDETIPFHCYANYDRKNQGSYDLALINDAPNGNGAKATTFAVGQQAIIASNLAHLKAEVVKQFKACQECHAIIAVPSFASDNHRRVILEAAQLAGCFQSVQMLNQTTAALIAYTWEQQKAHSVENKRGIKSGSSKKQTNVEEQQQLFGLICFGGGSFECSLFRPLDANDNNRFSPKLVATAGTTEFGSSSFTDRLAQWCLSQIDPDDGNSVGLVTNVRKQIWEKCEQAKKRLSEQESTTIALHLHYPDNEEGLKAVNVEVQRANFEYQCHALLAKLGQIIEGTFRPSRGKIGYLLLVGEGCRMPELMQMVEPYLAKNCVNVGANFDTEPGDWVIKGVAIKAWAVERLRQNGNNSAASFEDLLYRHVDLAFPTAGISLNLFKPDMQIPTDESLHFKYDRTREDAEFLLTENGLQIVVNTRLSDNSADVFKQFAFHVDLNGLLQLRSYFYNSRGEHKGVISCVDWPNLYGNDGLNELREELENLSILPLANAKSNDRVEEDRNAPNVDDKCPQDGRANCRHTRGEGKLAGQGRALGWGLFSCCLSRSSCCRLVPLEWSRPWRCGVALLGEQIRLNL